MWNKTEYSQKPQEIDNTSSKVYVYIRKNIQEETRTNPMGDTEETYTIYTCDEQKIKKDDWETYQKLIDHTSQLSDIDDALVELAGLIEG